MAAVRDPLLRAGDPPAVAVRVGAAFAASRRRSRPRARSARTRRSSRRARAAARTRSAARRCRTRGSAACTALVCTATVTPTPASARESSSSTRMYERKSAPAPPYSSGTQTPISPSSASFAKSSRGKRCSRSQCGRVRLDLGLRDVARERLDLPLVGRQREVHGRESTRLSPVLGDPELAPDLGECALPLAERVDHVAGRTAAARRRRSPRAHSVQTPASRYGRVES